jgi:cyclopropane-fatty-acyl-phospholipid synthase
VHATPSRFVPHPSTPAPAKLDRWCLARVAEGLSGADVRLALWDGTSTDCSCAPPVATVRIADRRTLLGILLRPDLEVGEAYSDGRVVIDGDLVQALESVNRAYAVRPPRVRPVRQRRIPGVAARRNVHAHYDLGNEFYRLWLDDSMAYTCAYFERPDASLEDAQRAKFEYVCRKVRLRPGDRVADVGCGWGGLALHMVRHYDVTVRAYNVSQSQLAFARDRARREGLDGRVTFVDADYRAIDAPADVFVSIGMLEHVGLDQYPALGSVIDRVLDGSGGRGLFHFIGHNSPTAFGPWITRHIFPGAYAPTLGEVLQPVLEAHRFSVLDVENLRPHYALTLHHWLTRFERHVDDVRLAFDDAFVRTWRLYLASAQACFTTGDLQLFQVTFGRPADNTAPWTRHGWYRGGGESDEGG